MSSANAAAKRRRVNLSTPSPQENFQPSPQNYQSSQQKFQPSQQNFQPSPQNFQSSQQNFQSPSSQSASSVQSSTNPQGLLTLPQVIALVDSRLIKLENKSNENIENNSNEEYFQESETRFEIMAQEIADIKQIVLSLQSYTMDVNRILMEEKLQKSGQSSSLPTAFI